MDHDTSTVRHEIASGGAGGLSRRRFLAGAAATSTAVWVAPAITGAPLSAAFAQASPVPDDPNGNNDTPNGNNDTPNGNGTPEDPGGEVGGVRFDDTDPDVEVAGVSLDRRQPDSGVAGVSLDRRQPDSGVAGVTLTAAGQELPRTGHDVGRLLGLGVAAVAGGAAMVRKTRSTPPEPDAGEA